MAASIYISSSQPLTATLTTEGNYIFDSVISTIYHPGSDIPHVDPYFSIAASGLDHGNASYYDDVTGNTYETTDPSRLLTGAHFWNTYVDVIDVTFGFDPRGYSSLNGVSFASLLNFDGPSTDQSIAIGISGGNTVWMLGGGNDSFLSTGTTNDLVNGGSGNDELLNYGQDYVGTVDYSDSPSGIIASLDNYASPTIDGVAVLARKVNDGWGTVDTVQGFGNINGSLFSDIIVGSYGANLIQGFDGDDIIAGLAGADVLDGGAGIDTLYYAYDYAPYPYGNHGVTVNLSS